MLAKAGELGWFGSFVQVGGRDVHHVCAGAAGQELPLLLLHGFGAWSYSWRRVLRPLAGRRRACALDLPGFGLSEKSGGGDYSVRAQVGCVHEYLDALGWERAVLVGNSYGGEVAWRFALHHPQRVAALVLIAASAYITGPPPLGRRLLRLPAATLVARLLVGNARFFRRALRDACYAPEAMVTPALVEGYCLPLQTPAAMPAFLAMLRTLDVGAEADRTCQVRVPSLLIWGDRDPWVPLDHGQRLAREIPGARLVVLPQTGHVPQEERPEETYQAIEEFLREAL